MTAVVWRLHRQQAFFAGAAMALVTVVLVITGLVMAHDYHQFMATCAATDSCADASSQLYRGDGMIMDLVYASVAVPVLFGLFWGAPLLAREFDEGTHNLAWTQGVNRRGWLSPTMTWALLAAAVWGGALSALVTWWRSPENALGLPGPRFNPGLFDIQGLVPVAYSVFAVALGIAAGAVLRRVLPSMAVALGGFVLVRVVIDNYLRAHYMPAVTKLVSFAATPGQGAPIGSWRLSSTIVTGGGIHLGDNIGPFAMPTDCADIIGTSKTAPTQCLAAHGWHLLVSYQPPSRFWAFQGIESAIFLVLTALLVIAASVVVLRRDA